MIAVLALYLFIPIVALSAMPVHMDSSGNYVTELGIDLRRRSDPRHRREPQVIERSDRPAQGVRRRAGRGDPGDRHQRGPDRGFPPQLFDGPVPAAAGGDPADPPDLQDPYIAIIFFAVLAIITLIPGQASFLATMYSFGAMLSFTIAHAAVIRLRQKQPDAERAWQPRGTSVSVAR